MNNRFLLILAAVIVVLGGIFFFTREDSTEAPGGEQVAATQNTFGNNTTGVTVEEYGDFECPACSAYFPIVQQIKQDYAEKINFQFRHFPLVQIHPNAMIAARAAEAAGKQGKFWEMHDLLYGQQQSWAGRDNATVIFEDYATQLGLNIDQYKTDAAAKTTLDAINADVRVGQGVGVSATPTFVINGTRIEETPRSYEDFAKLIDEAIAKQKQ
jgi:protein-disulfide isomerase